jgi:hypothetical protein
LQNRFQPLLSAKVFVKKAEDTEKNMEILRKRISPESPASVSIKWDGWRMFEYNGAVLCRSMDPPRNPYVQEVFAEMFRDLKEQTGLVGLDGEAIGGDDPMAKNAMQASSSRFNRDRTVVNWTFQAFDSYQFADKPFTERLERVGEAVAKMQSNWPWLQFTEHKLLGDVESIMEWLAELEAMGAEGVMGRDPAGRYKLGRSTMKDGILWALKPYADGDCIIESLHEMMSNQNEATLDSRGYTKRPGGQAGMVPKGTFGYAICRGIDPVWPQTFRIGMGPGLDDKLRAHIWANKEKYVGAPLKYKYQAVGCVERPRQPKWMGIRGKSDML